ncbi:MAG: ABC transporter ATP-binding protein [Actinomycetota bacterium]
MTEAAAHPVPPAIELIGITKRFPGVLANQDVNLCVETGTLHAIVGENGAGKSTLMRILYGLQRPDAGTISVNGEPVHFRSARDAIRAGIGMVHQHFQLMDNFTVLENIVLGDEPRTRGVLTDFETARRRIGELSELYGLSVSAERLVGGLTVGARQRVEILKVLYRGARILILDEPTAVLVPQESQDLFASLDDLTDQGVTVVFIDHKLDEVLAHADAITVMRGGRTIDTVAPSEVTVHQLAELMVGAELPTPSTDPEQEPGPAALEARDLTKRADDRLALDVEDLTVRRGEIVGIAGVEGNGQHELIEALLGIAAITSGQVLLDGKDVTHASTRDRREAGLGIIPHDRTRDGLLLDSPLWENAALGHQSQVPYARGPWFSRRGARTKAREINEVYDVRTPSVDVSAHALSGGNQQKLIIGREMAMDPHVLIAAHPTRGIDVGAQAAVWQQLRIARRQGLAVLLISADLEELLGLSDVLRVIFRGRLVATLDPGTVTSEELGSYMAGFGAQVTS